ncbi:hypothetical protein CLOM_g4954 [Closterium sp. NIES-68]|nr:hypothetical protein CLOM_g4954 [Closterium sp. NIES-68]GJP79989.1 hypothetical protein CLOP_g10214 [Closterium sp. NIES-67]
MEAATMEAAQPAAACHVAVAQSAECASGAASGGALCADGGDLRADASARENEAKKDGGESGEGRGEGEGGEKRECGEGGGEKEGESSGKVSGLGGEGGAAEGDRGGKESEDGGRGAVDDRIGVPFESKVRSHLDARREGGETKEANGQHAAEALPKDAIVDASARDIIQGLEPVSKNAASGDTSAQDSDKPLSKNATNGDASAPDSAQESDKPLSKNAQKKLAKRQAMQERKDRAREDARLAREAQQKRAEQEAAAAEASLTAEERAEAAARQREKAEARRAVEAERRRAWAEKAEKGPGLIIDLEFEELMGERELSSLQQQVMFSYALNQRAPAPCRLTLSGLPPTSPFLQRLQRIAGFESWQGVTVEPRAYIEAWRGREGELVYLTADAEEEVGEVEPGKVYVVGGLWIGISTRG